MDILKSFENLHLLVRGIDPEKIEVENIFKNCILKSSNSEDFYKSWSSDLKEKFPNGDWRTVNGAKVFINGGKVVAGLDGFNGEIDKFFKEKESKKTPDKPVNERSAEEIFRAKQEIANSMPKPINKMTWKEFKPYGVEMAKQSSLGQPDGFYEKQAKFEHDWAIKNDKSQYATTDKQKQGGTEKETADKKPNHFTSLSDLEKHVTDGGKLSKDDTYTLETKKSLEKKYGDRNPIYKMEASIQEEKRNEKLKTDKLNESEQKFYKENLDSFRKHIKEQGLNLEDLIMDGELESEKRKWVDQNKPKDTKGASDKLLAEYQSEFDSQLKESKSMAESLYRNVISELKSGNIKDTDEKEAYRRFLDNNKKMFNEIKQTKNKKTEVIAPNWNLDKIKYNMKDDSRFDSIVDERSYAKLAAMDDELTSKIIEEPEFFEDAKHLSELALIRGRMNGFGTDAKEAYVKSKQPESTQTSTKTETTDKSKLSPEAKTVLDKSQKVFNDSTEERKIDLFQKVKSGLEPNTPYSFSGEALEAAKEFLRVNQSEYDKLKQGETSQKAKVSKKIKKK